MRNQILFKLLRKMDPTIVYNQCGINEKCWFSTASIYFQDPVSGFYERIELTNEEQIESYLDNIVKVEKDVNNKPLIIWTKENKTLIEFSGLIQIRGKYYTEQYLSDILDKIRTVKSVLDTIQTNATLTT